MYPTACQRVSSTARTAATATTLVTMLCCFVLALPFQAQAQKAVTTWHYNNARTGANTAETHLTPVNVNYHTFGKLFEQPVDGYIVGQPLYLPGVTIVGKGVHNTVYVATNHDTVYAFDADSASGQNAQPLWKTSILKYSPPGATSVPISVVGGGGTTGFTEHGIVSTPVINPATNVMYVVADTYESGQVVHRLHALDVTTGYETLGGPATISASFTLSGQTYQFHPHYQMNRPALLLANGHVYIGWGGNGNNGPEQGWVMSYNATSLQPEGAFDVEPGTATAAVWQHGAGLASDAFGRIYGQTGDGPYTEGTNFSESVLKWAQSGADLTLADYFTPYNYTYLTQHDLDMSNGLLVLPYQAGPYPHELISVSKGKTVYVLNRDNMGHLCSSCQNRDTQIIQEFDLPGPEPGTPVYWYGRVYFTPGGQGVQYYTVNNGILSLTRQSVLMPSGRHVIVTSNGSKSGIVWTLNQSAGVGTMVALDASTLSILYKTSQAPNGRDQLPTTVHFAMPIVADGKLFIGTETSLVVYGLL